MKKEKILKPRYRFVDENKEHLHLLDERPLTGTSSVVNVLAKNLTWWAAETAAVECLEAGIKIPTIREEYEQARISSDKKQAIDALQKKYPIFKKARFAHYDDKNKKADKGVDLHAELEHWVKAQMGKHPVKAKYDARIKPFTDWCAKEVKSFIASEGHCYSEKLWVGGITDLIPELNNGELAVLDFKSSKEAFPGQFIQCGGYAIEIEENGLLSQDGKYAMKLDRPITKLIVVPFGAEVVVPEIKSNVEDWKKGFRDATGLYRILGLEK